MGTISLNLPSDGQTIDSSDVNNPFNTISTAINGNLDDTNIAAGANINGSKLLAASVPGTALDTNIAGGWITGVTVPNAVAANGNRSYTLTVNTTDLTSKLSPGMRLRFTRTVAAPTQCTSLNGSTQYYSKTSPAGMTFTNNFVVSAWIKLSAYNTAANQMIASRYNGTSGWQLLINTSGQVSIIGFNGGAANFSGATSFQSIPLNKWIHVTAQLDMATFTATPTTSYVMIDGLDVPTSVTRSGTNPTALIQAGNLEIGGTNGGTLPFNGKIAQAAVYSAKVTQATILAAMPQTLAGTETSLVSAYSFNNTIADLNTTNANNLTANGSAVATSTDSPFGGQASGTISSTLDYGIITSASFSTNTTLVVQVPEGCTIPTSGGVSAVAYAGVKAPYGLPIQSGKWHLTSLYKLQTNCTSNATFGTFNSTAWSINAPIGEWNGGYDLAVFNTSTTNVYWNMATASVVGVAAGVEDTRLTTASISAAASAGQNKASIRVPFSLTVATVYSMYTLGATTASGTDGDNQLCQLILENAYL